MRREYGVLGILAVGGAAIANAQVKMTYTVQYKGAMSAMYQPNGTAGKIAVKPLRAKPHLYALGPLDKLSGEITVWDGKLRTSKVNGDVVEVKTPMDAKAVFLVWTYVSQWREIVIPDDVRTYKQLEMFVGQKATQAGHNTASPIPFLVKGTAERAEFHVVNYVSDGSPLTREKHDAAKAHFPLENEAVNLLGFYSTKHKGIFTPPGSNMHLHLITADGEKMGQCDDLVPGKTMRLYLPKL